MNTTPATFTGYVDVENLIEKNAFKREMSRPFERDYRLSLTPPQLQVLWLPQSRPEAYSQNLTRIYGGVCVHS